MEIEREMCVGRSLLFGLFFLISFLWSPMAALALPDLRVESIKNVPAQAGVGQTLQGVEVCIKNAGTSATAAGFDVQVVYSTTSFLAANSGIFLKVLPFTSTLAANATSCQKADVTLPLVFNASTHYLGVYVDPQNRVTELVETNNGLTQGFLQAKPDLLPEKIDQFPASAKAGDTVSARLCVKNSGNFQAANFKVALYFSSNSLISTGDIKLKETTLSLLAAGASTCVTLSGTVPLSATPGDGYFGAYVNDDNGVSESTTSNNTLAAKFTVQASGTVDLQFGAVTGVPTTANPGDLIAVKVCVKNGGTGASSSFPVAVYFSTDTTISPLGADPLLGQVTFAGIGPSATSCLTINATLPKILNPKGTPSYIGVVLDQTNIIKETDETDNIKAFPFANAGGLPDYIISNITGVPGGASPGQTLNNLTVCVKNQGQGDGPAFVQVSLLHSDSNIIFPTSTVLQTLTFSTIKSQTELCQKNLSVTLPATVKPGKNWFGAAVDFQSAITEENELNNDDLVGFNYLTPDLVVDSVTGAPTKPVLPGAALQVKVCIKNDGGADLPAQSEVPLALYVAKQASVSPQTETPLLTTVLKLQNPLPAIGTQTLCHTFQGRFPKKMAPGTALFLVAYVDPLNTIVEALPTNNTKATTFNVDQYDQPDLEIAELSGFPSQALKPGDKVTLKVCTVNQGKVDASAFRTGIYFSKDLMINGKDAPMFFIDYPNGLQKGRKDCRQVSFVLTSALSPGVGYLGAWADDKDDVFESNESDNFQVSPALTISTFDQPDLVVRSFGGVNGSLRSGDTFTLSVCVENKGKGELVGDFAAGVYLSKDGAIQQSDTLLTTVLFRGGLKAGAALCRAAKVTIPLNASLPAYLGPFVDWDERIAEDNELNNFTRGGDIGIGKGTGGVDLAITKLQVTPAFGPTGTVVSVEVCTENVGGLDVKQPFTTTILHSNNDLITKLDTKLLDITYKGSDLLNFRKGGPGDCKTVKVAIPSSVSEGVGYIGALADGQTLIPENDESNNAAGRTFVVPSKSSPNLIVTSIQANPAAAFPGQKVEITTCIANYGVAIPATKTFKLGLWLLEDFFYDPGAPVFSTKIQDYPDIKGLGANQSACYKMDVTLPTQAVAGERYLAAWVDYSDLVKAESSEGDNDDPRLKIDVLQDLDKDGVPSHVDCDDNNPKAFPAYDGKPAAKEVCDFVDNNCDGKVDESFANVALSCTAGRGDCEEKGVFICKADGSGTSCSVTGIASQPERCDGIDNDCNGLIDDNVSQACGAGFHCVQGSCQPLPCNKRADCPAGWGCRRNACQAPSICQVNGDCLVDETCVSGRCERKPCQQVSDCAVGQICRDGECVVACVQDADCPQKGMCMEGWCRLKCTDNTDCIDPFICVGGTCQAPCSSVCKEGQRCKESQCVEDNCYTYPCAKGRLCLGTKCIADPCAGVSCKGNEFCANGTCIAVCAGVTCPSGEICRNGSCEGDPCARVQCDTGKLCRRGVCEEDRCGGLKCGSGRICGAAGSCVDDPCFYVTCPDPTSRCVVDTQGSPQCRSPVTNPPEGGEREPAGERARSDAGAGPLPERSLATEPDPEFSGPDDTSDRKLPIVDALTTPDAGPNPGMGCCAALEGTPSSASWLLCMSLLLLLASRKRSEGP